MIQFSFKNPNSVSLREENSDIRLHLFYRDSRIVYVTNKMNFESSIMLFKTYSMGAKYLRDINTDLKIECEGFIGYGSENGYVHITPDNLNENIGENIGLCVYPFTIELTNYQINFTFDQQVESVHGGYQIMDIIVSMDHYSKKFRSNIRKFMKNNTITHFDIIQIAKFSGIRIINTNSVDPSIIDKDLFEESLKSKIFKNVTLQYN